MLSQEGAAQVNLLTVLQKELWALWCDHFYPGKRSQYLWWASETSFKTANEKISLMPLLKAELQPTRQKQILYIAHIITAKPDHLQWQWMLVT